MYFLKSVSLIQLSVIPVIFSGSINSLKAGSFWCRNLSSNWGSKIVNFEPISSLHLGWQGRLLPTHSYLPACPDMITVWSTRILTLGFSLPVSWLHHEMKVFINHL